MRLSRIIIVLLASVVLCVPGCGSHGTAQAGARIVLPAGDAEAGRDSYEALRCWACHPIAGHGLPGPTVDPPVPVPLGRDWATMPSDGELFTAIVDPNHQLAPQYERELLMSNGSSRMGEFADAMTVRQLLDLIAFLKAVHEEQGQP